LVGGEILIELLDQELFRELAVLDQQGRLVEGVMFVASIKRIRKGDGSLNIIFSRGGIPIEGFTCFLHVKQFTSDPAIITRELTPVDNFTWSTILTTAETVMLKVGLWHAFGVLKDATTGEGRGIADGDVRFQVQPSIST